MYFNMDFGYLEAVLRGFRSGFLHDYEYRQLCQCDTLEDFKLVLGDTDMCNVLQSSQRLTPDIIRARVRDKWVGEFQYIRRQGTGQLATFCDILTHEYLIASISFVISSLIKGADPETLLEKCHPLGRSPHLKSVMTFEYQGDGLMELYRTVLIDTPVAKYFEQYFNSEMQSDQPSNEIMRVYNEVEIDIITNMLQKLWLEDFYRYCQALGGETALVMGALLSFEADRRAIQITLNSFGTNLNELSHRDERSALYCNFGTLYPEGMKAFGSVGDMGQLQAALEPYTVYAGLLRKSQEGALSFNDCLFEHEVKLNVYAFDSQSHFACFYAFTRLRLQEERNVKWIASCINQRRDQREFDRWIKVF
jgi:V-type H+-transporting ATPase subunit d